MTCECGKDPCCCASITGIKGGIHPDAIKTIHMDLTLEEADASQTITHISKVLLNEPCHIVAFDAASPKRRSTAFNSMVSAMVEVPCALM